MVLCALFLAFGVVSTIVFKMIPMGALPYLRFSLTPSIVICASLFLGPFFGFVVGLGSDMIPAFILPTGDINFFISAVYGCLGILPAILWAFVNKNPKISTKPQFFIVIMAVIFLLTCSILYIGNPLDEAFGEISTWLKPTILVSAFLIDAGLIVSIWYLNKKNIGFSLPNVAKTNIFQLALIVAISEAFLMVFAKSAAFYIQYWLYGSGNAPSFWYFLATTSLGFPVSVFVDVYFLRFFLPLFERLAINR